MSVVLNDIVRWVERHFFSKAVHRGASSGAVHAALPVVLDAAGQLDDSFTADVLTPATRVTTPIVQAAGAAGLRLEDDGGNKAVEILDLGKYVIYGDGTGANNIGIDGAAGSTRQLSFKSGGVLRWLWTVSSETESGGNAGSNLQLWSRSDAGAALNSSVIVVERASGWIGFNTVPAGQVHVDQSSTTGAVPVLILDQADLSEEFIEFDGTVAAGNPIDTAAVGSYYGKVRVSVNGTFKFLSLYNS